MHPYSGRVKADKVGELIAGNCKKNIQYAMFNNQYSRVLKIILEDQIIENAASASSHAVQRGRQPDNVFQRLNMNRHQMIHQLSSTAEWDICIIGGGATGLGTAVDAATRGFRTILFEQHDFAKGTSSRSTKLVHGGVRYLQQGNIRLVLEALKERGLLIKNAPHLVHNQKFIVPNYKWWEGPFYGIGLKIYDWMAGKLGLGPSEFLSKEETLKLAPTLDPEGLRGGIVYHDGQFDDARLAIDLAQTAAQHNAVVLNYFPVTGSLKAIRKSAVCRLGMLSMVNHLK
jgi:glycerol-3-phosphate dehydrogenase